MQKEYIRDKSLYSSTGEKWIPFSENRELQEQIAAITKQTKDELKNITQSFGWVKRVGGKIVATKNTDFFQTTLDNAMMDISSGTFSASQVMKRAIHELTSSGMRQIVYDNNGKIWTNTTDVAVRRAIQTGMHQLQAKRNESVADQLGTEYFEVTWHAGARPTHQVWQGRIYSREQLKSVCGLGSVTGLCGANCYHNYMAFIPGVSIRNYTDKQLDAMSAEENTPKEYGGKKYTTYEALQQQRYLERVMRKERQDIVLFSEAGETEEAIIAKAKYQGTMGEYVKFSKAMNLPQQMDRVYQDGLGRVAKISKETTSGDNTNKEIFTILKVTTEKSGVKFPEKQFGKKIGKHTSDYGLNPGSVDDRIFMAREMDDIITNGIKIPGTWKSQQGETYYYDIGVKSMILFLLL